MNNMDEYIDVWVNAEKTAIALQRMKSHVHAISWPGSVSDLEKHIDMKIHGCRQAQDAVMTAIKAQWAYSPDLGWLLG